MPTPKASPLFFLIAASTCFPARGNEIRWRQKPSATEGGHPGCKTPANILANQVDSGKLFSLRFTPDSLVQRFLPMVTVSEFPVGAANLRHGEVAEWFNAHAWKA